MKLLFCFILLLSRFVKSLVQVILVLPKLVFFEFAQDCKSFEHNCLLCVNRGLGQFNLFYALRQFHKELQFKLKVLILLLNFQL